MLDVFSFEVIISSRSRSKIEAEISRNAFRSIEVIQLFGSER
jgi:hypothetical protein